MKRISKRGSLSAAQKSLAEFLPAAASGSVTAIKKFRAIGESAIPGLVAAMQGPSPPGIHGRDFLENLTAAIAEACYDRAGEMIRIIRAGELKADPFMWLAVSALQGSRDPKVNDLFLNLLEHKESLIREAAAEGIVQRCDRRAIDPLLVLLRRSRADSMLTFIIVSGMRRVPEMQDARAIPVLERLLARRRISPGTVAEGTALLATLRELEKPTETVERLDWTSRTISDDLLKIGTNASQLKSLILEDVTNLNHAAIETIGRWTTLQELVMEWKYSRSPVLDTSPLEALTRLRRLCMKNCQLNDEHMSFLSKLTQLEELDFWGLNVSDEALSAISEGTRLRKIRWGRLCSENSLKWLVRLKGLRQLRFELNSLTSVGTTHLARLKKLQVLDTGYSRIDDASLEILLSLQDLRMLVINGGSLSAKGVALLTHFPMLTHLDLDGTMIGDSGLRVLAKCRQLKALSLRRAGLSKKCGSVLAKMKNLEQLIVHDQITGDGRKALQTALPRIRINGSYRLDYP